MGLSKTYIINFSTSISCLWHFLEPRRGDILVEVKHGIGPKSCRDDMNFIIICSFKVGFVFLLFQKIRKRYSQKIAGCISYYADGNARAQ